MKKSIFAFLLLISGLLFANGKVTSASTVQKDALVIPAGDLSKTAGIISNLLSVFEEGIIQPGTGIVHSTFNPVRTVSLGFCGATHVKGNKINRQTVFQFLCVPLAGVKLTAGLQLFLQVFLI